MPSAPAHPDRDDPVSIRESHAYEFRRHFEIEPLPGLHRIQRQSGPIETDLQAIASDVIFAQHLSKVVE